MSERLLAHVDLGASDRRTLLDCALRLRRGARDGVPPPLLRGRHLAIAGVGRGRVDVVVEAAATMLGARVSRIAPDGLFDHDPATALAAARVLARLYDGLACHRLPASRALELHRRAGVPVYLELGGAHHPIRALLAEMTVGLDRQAVRDDLASLVQAVLLETLA